MRAGAELLLVALMATGAGCSGIGDLFLEPDIQLDRVVVRGIGATGGNLDLILKVANPNQFSLHGTRLQLGIDIEGSHLGDVAYDDDFSVSENGTTTITLPLAFGWTGVGSAIRAALAYGDLPYKMRGQAELKTPWGRKEFPFTHEGRVPLVRSGSTATIPAQAQ